MFFDFGLLEVGVPIWFNIYGFGVREKVNMVLDGTGRRKVGGFSKYVWVTGQDGGDWRW